MIKGKDRALNIEGPEFPKDYDYDSWNQPSGWFDWPVPLALSWERWDEWHIEMKAKYPFRHFFYYDLPQWWRGAVVGRITDAQYWVLYRIHPKHRYHVINTGLKPSYYDPDTLILEGNFKLLCDFVDYNIKEQIVAWDADEEHEVVWKEMQELVVWYRTLRPNREDDFEKLRPKRPDNFSFRDDAPESLEYQQYLKERHEMQEKWAQEDEDNLIRLVKLRSYMWYA